MAKQFVFASAVSESARLSIDDLPRWREALKFFAGKRCETVLRAPKSRRSLDLNNYWHSETGPFRLFAEHVGESIPGIKLALLGHCFGWTFSSAAGREIPVKGHTSELTVDEGKFFTDWMITFGATEYGLLIPKPQEIV